MVLTGRVRSLGACFAGAALLGSVAACGISTGGDGAVARSTAPTPASSAPASSVDSTLGDQTPDPVTGAPAAFTSRPQLPSCGVAALSPFSKAPPSPATSQAVSCFEAALGSAAGAELEVRSPTVEGDPIVSYLRALPGASTVATFTDSTADKFGTRIWTGARCTGFDATAPAATGCTKQVNYLARPIEGKWLPRSFKDFEFPDGTTDRSGYAIDFRNGEVFGSDGCNSFSGSYRVDAVGQFRSEHPVTTLVACPGTASTPTYDVIDDATDVVITRDVLRFMDGESILADFVPND